MRSRTSRAGMVVLGATFALLLTATAAHAGVAFPQAHDDTASTTKNHAVDINVLANDTVPPGFQVSGIEIESDPQHGTATINGDNSIHYVPDSGYVGADTMMYNLCYLQVQKVGDVQAQGARGSCGSTANVDITVTAPPATTTTTVPPTTVPATVAAVTTAPATNAPTTTVAAAAATNELPRTGGGNGQAAAFGGLVLAAGLALVGGARYRRRHA